MTLKSWRTQRMSTRNKCFRGCPPYLGGKRRLAAWILAELAAYLPPPTWPGLTLVDPMCGGGAMAVFAQAQGFRVEAGDAAERAAVVARALIANPGQRLTPDDILRLGLGGWPRGDVPTIMAALLARVDVRPEPIRSLLRLVLIHAFLRAHPLSLPSASDAAAAARGDFDRITPRRLGTYLRGPDQFAPLALTARAEGINEAINGGRGDAVRQDACTTLRASDARVAYLDPPYPGTTGYRRAYRRLDRLLGDPDDGGRPPSLDGLLTAAEAIPWVVLSYGGPRLSLDRLTAQVARHRTVVRAVAVPYPHLAAIASQENQRGSHEFLIIARR